MRGSSAASDNGFAPCSIPLRKITLAAGCASPIGTPDFSRPTITSHTEYGSFNVSIPNSGSPSCGSTEIGRKKS
jgi:hypothetical protein